MARRIFVNLPVADLAQSRRFYSALGFSFNEQFSDDTAACMVIDDTIFAMLLTHAKFARFTTRPIADTRAVTAVLTAIQLTSREEVDRMAFTATSAGGREHRPVEDLGFMISRSFEDPDGHVWEPFWMGPASARSP